MGVSNGTSGLDYEYPKPTHESVIVDGVLRWPSTGLKVLVGAGPGGYLTALECWRKGHDVEVLEKNSENSPIGDIVFIGPSALATIKYYPAMLQQYSSISTDCVCSFRSSDGAAVAPPIELEYNRDDVPEHAAWPLRIRGLVTRAGFADMLWSQCQRLGIPIRFGVKIVNYAEDDTSAYAVAADGQRLAADVVVAADGLGTKSHEIVLGHSVRAVPTGYIICRIYYKLDEAQHAPLLKMLEGHIDRGDLRTHSGENFHCIVVMSRESITIGYTLLDENKGTEASESWAQTISSEEFVKLLPNSDKWDPLILEIFRQVPNNSVIKWQLCWRDPQEKWTSPGARVIQLGDSAHAFIPSSISGATTALEDALSLAECLRLAGKDAATVGTRVHELLRLRRVSVLQRLGFANRREMHRAGGIEEMMKDASKTGPMGLGKWIWTHNPEVYARERFAEARRCLETGEPLEHTNLPPGFKWEPWSMQDEIEKETQGIYTDLKLNGDWGIH